MKISKTELKRAIQAIKSTIETKEANLFSRVWMDIAGDKLRLRATNGEANTTVVVDAIDPIECDIEYKTLVDFLRTASNEIEIIQESSLLFKIKSGITSMSFGVYIFDIEDKETIKRELDSDIEGISYPHDIVITQSAIDAIDPTAQKFELAGLLIDFKSGRVAGTDMHRLTVQNIEPMDLPPIIIPKQYIKAGLISEIVANKDELSYIVEDTLIKTKLIHGKYPDIERIIPNHRNIKIGFNSSDFKKLKYRDSEIIIKDNICTIIEEKSNKIIKFECDYPSSYKIQFRVNVKYIADALSDGKMTIGISMNSIPIVVENNDIKTIIMPIMKDEDSVIEYHYGQMQSYGSTFQYGVVKPKAKSTAVKLKEQELEINWLKKQVALLEGRLEKYEAQNSQAKKDKLAEIFTK